MNKLSTGKTSARLNHEKSQVEAERGCVLNRLKAYRRADPTFQQDKNAFISAEAELGASDPMEAVTYKVARRRSLMPKASAPKEKVASAMKATSKK